MSKYTAVGFRVHIKPDQTETELAASKAGIELPDWHPDTKAERVAVDTGTVVAVGPDAFKAFQGEPWCVVGDRVVYARHSGRAVGTGNDKIIVVNDEDIITKETESV